MSTNSPNSPDDRERLELGRHRICTRCQGKGHEPGRKAETCRRCGGRRFIDRNDR